jgi:hypothetical protein
VSVCASSGDSSCGEEQEGPALDILSPRWTTQFTGRRPGEIWALELYDSGTCDDVRHVVATSPLLRIGSNGRRTMRVFFSTPQLDAITSHFWEAQPSRLRLRVSNGELHLCARYGNTFGDG